MAEGIPEAPVASVAVVIPIFNQARYLADALDSVLAQTRPVDEIIVVDDVSSDDPAAVTAGYPRVRLIRHEVNQGQAGARNTGASAASTRFVLFLDADDLLVPEAVEQGLAQMAENPDSGLVYGAYQRIDGQLRPVGGPLRIDPGANPHHALLRTNIVGMIAAALFDRAKLLECGGFDVSLRRCEDYDCYFRMVRRWPLASHEGLVALYRMHGTNQTADPVGMLAWCLRVLDRHRPPPEDREATRAYEQGREQWRAVWAHEAWKLAAPVPRRDVWAQRARMAQISLRASLGAIFWQKLGRHMPHANR